MNWFAVLLTLLASTVLAPSTHDFHVSITTIKHNTDTDELQLTIKMTTHDVEYALEKELGGIAHFGSDKETEVARKALKAYILNRITIITDDETLALEYIGKEVEFEDMYCYLQVTGIEKYKFLEVHNALLFDHSAEQSNVVHVENNRGTKTRTCTVENAVVRFTP